MKKITESDDGSMSVSLQKFAIKKGRIQYKDAVMGAELQTWRIST